MTRRNGKIGERGKGAKIIDGQLTLNLSKSSDSLTVLKNLAVGGNLAYEGGNGKDVLLIGNLNAADPTPTEHSLIQTHGGNDRVVIDKFVDHSLWIRLGAGDDALAITTSTLTGSQDYGLYILGGEVGKPKDGNDVVVVGAAPTITTSKTVQVDRLRIEMGAGNQDNLSLTDVTADENALDGGLGKKDKLTITSSTLGIDMNGSPTGWESIVNTP